MPNDVSHIWTRFNGRWILTGVVSGLGAGAVMLIAAAVLSGQVAREFFFPAKLVGVALLGPKALQIDSNLGATAGLALHFALSAFFGLVFAHFVLETSRKRMLLLLGTLAGLAVWLFWSMMFMPAFNETMSALLPKTVSLLLHTIFGASFGAFVILLRPFLNNENATRRYQPR